VKIYKGDIIKIISGNDKGKQGKVLSVFPSLGRIVAESIHVKKKHVRPRQQGKKGEVVLVPAPFPAARAMVVCDKCGKATRIGSRVIEKRKLRVCKKCGREL